MRLKKNKQILSILFSMLFIIQIANALIINIEGPTTILEKDKLTLDILVTNNTGSTTFSKNLNEGVITKINDTFAKFEWTPDFGYAGTSSKEYDFNFIIADQNESLEISRKVKVNKVNNPFLITSLIGGGTTGTESNEITVATNRTNTICKYDLKEKPFAEMTYTMSSQDEYDEHKGIIKFDSSGSYSVYIMCEDDLKNNLSTYATINYVVKLEPKAEIYLTPSSPVRSGLIKIKLITTEPLIEAPTLTYTLTKSDAKESVTLVGSQTSWEGYMVIEKSNIEKVGTFEFKGISVNNLEGTDIIKNKIFIIDSEAPEAPTSIKATSQETRIRVEWHYPPEISNQITEYRVYRKENSGGTDYVDYYATTTNSYFLDEDIEYNKAYYYKVSAVKESGVEGELSKEFAITYRPEIVEAAETLSPVLRLELESIEKQIERYAIDMQGNLDRLNKEEGDKKTLIETLKIDSEIAKSIMEMNELRSELLDLEGKTLSKTEFEKQTQNILNKASNIVKNTPTKLEIIDSLKSQEGFNDLKTTNIFKQFLEAKKVNVSENEFSDYIQETVVLQQSIIIDVEKTLIKISYDKDSKNIVFINKKINAQGMDENLTIIENIPTQLTSNLRDISANIKPLVMQTRSLLVWEVEPTDEISITYFVETNSQLNELEEIKTIVSKSKIEQIKNNLLTGMVTGVSKTKTGLIIPTLVIGLIAVALALYYFYIGKEPDSNFKNENNENENNNKNKNNEIENNNNNNNNNDQNNNKNINYDNNNENINYKNNTVSEKTLINKKWYQKLKEKRMQIMPKENERTHKVFNFESMPEEPREISKEALNKESSKNTTEEKEEEQKMEVDEIKNKLKDYKEQLNSKNNIPAQNIAELYEVISEIKSLCDEIHNEKIYDYAQKTKKELEETIQKIEVQKNKKKEELSFKEQQKAPEGKEFWTYEGKKLETIKELKTELQEMPEYVFYYHVTPERNDFANWIENVFSDTNLSRKIKEIKNKKELLTILSY